LKTKQQLISNLLPEIFLSMNPANAILVLTYFATLAFGSGPPSAAELAPRGVLRQVNLVGSKNANGQWVDPRGLLTIKGPELGLSPQEIAQLRHTVGDVVCPGTQGTAFLVGQGRAILTNAHMFVDENGKDRANLDKCFWQNKDEPFQRILIETDEHNMKLFTRSTAKEFYLDLGIARLRQAIPAAHPFAFATRASVEIGEQLVMVSAGNCECRRFRSR